MKPNFFIVGAPKCGTTSLAEYLRSHENIFISIPKETHFFSTDYDAIRIIRSKEEYDRIFEDASSYLSVGDASTSYIYSADSLNNIYRYNPKAKIIVMIRSPIDLVKSLHSHNLFYGIESNQDLEVAWKKSKTISNNSEELGVEDVFCNYDHISRIGTHLSQAYSIFPDDQIMLILFKDFIEDTETVYRNVLEFLNLEYDGKTDFPKVNSAKRYKNEKIGSLINSIRNIYKYNHRIYSIIRSVKRKLGLKNNVWQTLFKFAYTSQYSGKNSQVEFLHCLKEELINEYELIQSYLPEGKSLE